MFYPLRDTQLTRANGHQAIPYEKARSNRATKFVRRRHLSSILERG